MDEIQDLAIEVAKAKDPADVDIEDRKKKLGRRLSALEERFSLLGVSVSRKKALKRTSTSEEPQPQSADPSGAAGHAALGEHPSDWACTGCGVTNFGSRTRCIECFAAAPPSAAKRKAEDPATTASAAEGEKPWKKAKGLKGDAAQSWDCAACHRSNAGHLGACEGCSASRPGLLKGDWVCGACKSSNFASRRTCFGCSVERSSAEEGKAGDWTCTSCQRLNFASRKDCFVCGLARQEDATVIQGTKKFETREGDWKCASCGGTNFSFRTSCFSCKAPRDDQTPVKAGHKQQNGSNAVRSRGPRWMCPSCQAPNAFQHSVCLGCQAPRNGVGLKLGDWVCGKCSEVNFRSKDACEGCGAPFGWDCACGTVNPKHRSRCSVCDVAKPGLDIPMGDWVCASCTGVNYTGRFDCYSCGTGRPEDTLDDRSKAMRDGWTCSSCRRLNFRWRETCHRCGAAATAPNSEADPLPSRAGAAMEVTPGDGGCEAGEVAPPPASGADTPAVDVAKKEKKGKRRKHEVTEG
eukprot:GGOE01019119.1.p1 GENE.GGOE01019119.1~~GGOE01019119.1.p1  ORF type:complete len:579 (-),score=84.85 GGOE01019119.1:192-1754(-)